jgi:ribosomal 50S subunit-associated protein YjgA (DUF615 family)
VQLRQPAILGLFLFRLVVEVLLLLPLLLELVQALAQEQALTRVQARERHLKMYGRVLCETRRFYLRCQPDTGWYHV